MTWLKDFYGWWIPFTAVLLVQLTMFSVSSALAETQEHFVAPNPAELDDDAAEAIYAKLKDTMLDAYKLSRNRYANGYQSWTRYNLKPYRSATHGQRFVNNYSNKLAKAYRLYENSGPLPAGAVLAKDSFTVSKAGGVNSGPLFLMEKMKSGFNKESGDWRYTMIMPDGSFFGETKGDGSAQVEFCITCHRAAAKNDHLFFMPESYRRKF
jgi:hypothetical protein